MASKTSKQTANIVSDDNVSPAQLDGVGTAQAGSDQAGSDQAGTEQAGSEQVKAGNFLRNDQSLVMRSARSDRFTEKFRDGIVQRILSGKTTIADVREQHYLTEQDVITWIKASYDRKQKRIDELHLQLRLAQPNRLRDKDSILKIESEPNRVTIDSDMDVIDVQAERKHS